MRSVSGARRESLAEFRGIHGRSKRFLDIPLHSRWALHAKLLTFVTEPIINFAVER
jgi:hypothetical protein